MRNVLRQGSNFPAGITTEGGLSDRGGGGGAGGGGWNKRWGVAEKMFPGPNSPGVDQGITGGEEAKKDMDSQVAGNNRPLYPKVELGSIMPILV